MLKRSKQLYQSGHCLPGGQKWTEKNYYTPVDKILTSGQILVFDVFKGSSSHKYSHPTILNRFGLAGLTTGG